MVREFIERRLHKPKNTEVVSPNITWMETKVTEEERRKVMRQIPVTIWLSGLSVSGKSTIAIELERQLVLSGHAAYTLDGDNVRYGLNRDLGFAPHDRTENIRRLGEMCKLFNNAGLITVTAFISPYRADRAMARDIIGVDKFIEVHLATTIDVCEQRDPKGLYKKARAGEINDFTGITAPYESPERPSMVIDTSKLNVEESVAEIMRKISPHFR